MVLSGSLAHIWYGWNFWSGLTFSIYVTACLRLFEGQQLSKLQSMPNEIHTRGRISNIPNKLLLAWLCFETTGFHSSADSFHSLFLSLECFCKSAYKLLALNKKDARGFLVLFGFFFFFFLKQLEQQLQGLSFHQGSPWEWKTTVKQKATKNREGREIPYKPLRKLTHLFISLWLLYIPKMIQKCSEVVPCRRWWL